MICSLSSMNAQCNSYLISVHTHGGQDKDGECNCSNETVASKFTGNSPESIQVA